MRAFLLGLALLATPALAIGTEEAPGASTEAAQALIDAGDFEGALRLLQPIVADEPGNADALNLAAYAHRNLGDLAEAGRLYEAALGADPDHLGALEYQGELLLQQGNRAGAEANLARLTELCGTCEERADLAEALAGS
jgi:tetratricopeptide (TPR) repeat protein